MGLVDDLLAETAGASNKRPKISRWLDTLDADVRDEWLAAFAHPDISGAAIGRALADAGLTASAATVTQYRRLHLPGYLDDLAE